MLLRRAKILCKALPSGSSKPIQRRQINDDPRDQDAQFHFIPTGKSDVSHQTRVSFLSKDMSLDDRDRVMFFNSPLKTPIKRWSNIPKSIGFNFPILSFFVYFRYILSNLPRSWQEFKEIAPLQKRNFSRIFNAFWDKAHFLVASPAKNFYCFFVNHIESVQSYCAHTFGDILICHYMFRYFLQTTY